jgi:adenosylmethionine-8-amino-7-oxononanoate aminotransferase
MARDADSLLRDDRAHVWHPYASGTDPLPVFPVTSAQGVRLRLASGRELVDGMSSWWAAIHGYGVPELTAALHEQANVLPHVMFGGLTHEPAVDLAVRLVGLTPEPLTRVFFSDSGSVAIEVALKMALQYWRGRGRPQKTAFLTALGGYHGDTLGAMSVSDPENGMHAIFRGVLPQQHFAPRPSPAFGAPWNESHIEAFEKTLRAHAEELAAVVLEPIVQGAGGMRFYAPEYLARVRQLCDAHGVLLILDEIATGFGRTGRLFGCEHAGVAPDIMAVGKALTGGVLTLAATLTTDEVARGISAGTPGVLLHGPTFMGNPLACAVARASIDLLLASPWQRRIAAIETQLERELEPARALPGVKDVRVLGAIGVIELDQPVEMRTLQQAFVDRGVWLRPFGRLVYTMPPYVIGTADLTAITTAMVEVLQGDGGAGANPSQATASR